MSSGDITYIADSMLIEKIASMEHGLSLQKQAGLPDSIFSGVANEVSNYVKNNIDTSSTGGLLKSVFNILTPGILFNRVSRIAGIAAAAGSSFGYSPSAVLESIVQAIKPKLMRGEQVTSEDVNKAGLAAAGGLGASADLLHELRGIEKKGELLKTAKAGGGSGVLGSIFKYLLSPHRDRNVSSKKKRAGKSIGIGVIVWFVKTVLLSAGLLAGGAAIKSMVDKDKESDADTWYADIPGYRRAKESEITPEMREDAKRSLSNPLGTILKRPDYAIAIETHSNAPKGASIFLKETGASIAPSQAVPASYQAQPAQPTQQSQPQARYVRVLGNPKNTLLQWTKYLHPELSGYEGIISSTPSFNSAVNDFSAGYQRGKSLAALPPGMSEKDMVNRFVSDVRARIAKEGQ